MTGKGFRSEGVEEVRREANLARIENRIIHASFRRRSWLTHRTFYNHYLMEWQLYRGEERFPRTCIMTGRQINPLNRKMILDFIQRLDEDEEATLWSWRAQDLPKRRDAERALMASMKDSEVLIKDSIIDHIQALNEENFPGHKEDK